MGILDYIVACHWIRGEVNAAINDLDASAEAGAGFVRGCVNKKILVEDLRIIPLE